MAKLEILVVDDQQEYCEVLLKILEKQGHRVRTCNLAKSALDILGQREFDLLISDLSMPEMDGVELLCKIKEQAIPVEVILLTAFGTIERAVEAMKLGAYSYVTKGNDPEELLHEVHKLEEMKTIQIENAFLKDRVSKAQAMLVSKNREYQKILDMATRVAESHSNILIYGESGSGKEVIAKYIHENSPRSSKNFMELNCQAISDTLLESELFGHEKGAFTGADKKHIGLFEASDGGTLFLDEIGGISQNLQGKLLKTIENKALYRVGSTSIVHTDFRLITATNRNLQIDMEKNLFRDDLFYRISTIVLEIPPLRQRQEDIPLFIDYFLQNYQKELKKKINHIDDRVMEFLLSYHYPGNVRELKNIIERLVVLAEDGCISEEFLPKNYLDIGDKNITSKKNNTIVQDENKVDQLSLRDYRARAEKNYIEHLIKIHRGDMNMVASVLGITRRQLLNKTKEFGL